jgi:pimeloyl-ACP methyl ester carboxylesterase
MIKLSTSIVLLGLLNFAQGQTNTLPKPSGEYPTGVAYLNFVDESRKELFDGSGRSYREMTVKAWYPSDRPSDPEPYLLAAEANFAAKYLQFPPLYKDLKTNSGRDVPVSSREKKYPILIFSHGWGEHYSQNTILMEELASHGYIVFSIAHHYECKFSSYPDGRFIYIDMGNPRFQKMWKEQMSAASLGHYEKLKKAASDEERERIFQEMIDALPILLTESPKYWAEDIAFLIDRLKIMNDGDNRFQNKLDLDRIGVFGMSMGGLATSVISSTDGRIKAGINMDGALPLASVHGKYQIPFLYLNSKRYLGCGPLLTRQSTQDGYSLSVKGSDHYNFTDYSVYPVPMVRFLLGPIDGKRTIEIMNVIIPAFFDKYVKGMGEIDLVKKAGKYPEIEISADLKSRPATTPPTAQDQAAEAVEKLVDVGGYNLNFRIIPGHGQAILLEAGGGMDSNAWNVLAPRLARATGATVIAYDRAGFGKSDLPETKYDLREDTATLWRGLRALGLDRNLVLVGHSYGGFLIRFEAAEHPEAVRGLVFVDPFTVEFVDIFGIEYCDNHPMMGKLPFGTSRPEKLSKVQRAMVRMVGAPGSNLADKIAVMRQAVVPEGIPARVITSGIAFLPKPEEQKAWRESHERFAASIKGAILVVAEKSGHGIPFSQPDLIVSVVSEVIRSAR